MSGMLADLRRIRWRSLTRVLISPASNMKVALPLYAMIATFLLLILAVGLMFVMATPEDEQTDSAPRARRKAVRRAPRAAAPMSREMRLFLGLGVVVIFLGVWVIAGFTTSDSGALQELPLARVNEHAKAEKGSDPHAQTNCVSCHESGGSPRPLRDRRSLSGVLHFAMDARGASDADGVRPGDDSCLQRRATPRRCRARHER